MDPGITEVEIVPVFTTGDLLSAISEIQSGVRNIELGLINQRSCLNDLDNLAYLTAKANKSITVQFSHWLAYPLFDLPCGPSSVAMEVLKTMPAQQAADRYEAAARSAVTPAHLDEFANRAHRMSRVANRRCGQFLEALQLVQPLHEA